MGDEVGDGRAEEVGDDVAVLEGLVLEAEMSENLTGNNWKRRGRTYGQISLYNFTEYAAAEAADGESEDHRCAAVVPYSP